MSQRPSVSQLFSNIFTGGSSQPAQQPAPQGNGPVPAPVAKAPSTPEPAFQPSAGQNPTGQTPTEAASPLDEFKDLFNIEVKEGEEQEDPMAPLFSLDSEKMKALASTQRFTDPEAMAELATKATQGDHSALLQLINQVSQNAFLKAAEFSTTVANRTGATAIERNSRNLPSQVKNLMSKDVLDGLNPAFSHAALAPMVNAVKQQVTQKYPDATPKQIADMTNKYLTQAAAQLKSPEAAPNPKDQPAESNWGDFFS